MALVFFLVKVFIISFSGAMQPGPVTATALAIGARNRYAGLLLALGHGIIEFPLMVLIMLGVGKLLKSDEFQITVGLAGGAILLFMAVQMLRALQRANNQQQGGKKDRPILAGIVLSGGNPYFLLWWATIGLALVTNAREFGIWAFGLFAVVHWLVDCGWLQTLSWASFKGSKVLGPRSNRVITMVCSMALVVFGVVFVYNAADKLLKIVN